MFKVVLWVLAAVAACLAVVGLAACGGGSGTAATSTATVRTATAGASVRQVPLSPSVRIPGDAVAEVNGQPVTRALLNRWMSILATEDFSETFSISVPKRLVFQPQGYRVCVADLSAIQTQYARRHSTSPVRLDLRALCRQLDLAVRGQALRYLIQYMWSVGQDAEQGIRITGGEVKREFKKVKAEEFPTEPALRSYLVRHGLTFADEIYEIRRNVINNKLSEKFSKAGGPEAESAYVAAVTPKWTALTSCRPGYVVAECKQYRTSAPTPSPNALIEELLQAPHTSSK